jgi:NDP-sugar pyrophosphorylase family protein
MKKLKIINNSNKNIFKIFFIIIIKMIIIIPLGGNGQRFKKNGYKLPKALIEVDGLPILYYLLINLYLKNVNFVYIPYNKEYKNYNFEEKLENRFPQIEFKFLCLEEDTRGAAETLNIALKNLDIFYLDYPILSLDSDSFYKVDVIEKWSGKNCVFTIIDKNEDAKYSYVQIDKLMNEYIIDIKEKVKISDYACTGAYGFESVGRLIKFTDLIIKNNIMQKNEFYTSGVIKEMIQNNHKFKNIIIYSKDFISLGTPKQVQDFVEKKENEL